MSLPRNAGGRAALAAALALAVAPAFGWGGNGHRIVAQIGEDRLSPETRRALRQLAGSNSLAMLATWPDFIRSEKGWDFANPWHFVTVEDDQTLDQVLEHSATEPGPDNIVEAIDYFTAILSGDRDQRRHFEQLMVEHGVTPHSGSLELTALSFLVHCVGDIHQPLHVGRGGDHGGNAISVNWFGEIENLHTVWDEGLIEREDLSFTEFVRFLEGELAAEIESGAGSGPVEWARESLAHRPQVYEIWSRTSRDNYLPELSYGYAHDQIGLVKRRLYLGGLRLAGLLDDLLAGDGG